MITKFIVHYAPEKSKFFIYLHRPKKERRKISAFLFAVSDLIARKERNPALPHLIAVYLINVSKACADDRRCLFIRFQPLNKRFVWGDIQRFVIIVYHHTGTRAARLFDVLYRAEIDRDGA